MGVRLTWQNNSQGDSNVVYRSSAPMDADDLPAPLDTILPSLETYEDLTAIDGETYYYRVSVVRGDASAVSAEVSLIALPEVLGVFASMVTGLEPACWLRLNEASGTVAADSSGNGRSGVYSVDASLLTAAGLLVGDSDAAVELPPALTPISIAAAPINTAANWTAGFVVKPDATPPDVGIAVVLQVGSDGRSCPEIDLVDRGSGRFGFRVMRSGTSELFSSASTWPYGQRVVVYLRQGGTSVDLLVDGELQGSTTSRWGGFGGSVRIGYGKFGPVSGYPLSGVLDEIQFYGVALNDTQIEGLAAAVLS